MRAPTEVEKAWMAGFVDGEGCINLHIKQRKKGNKLYDNHYTTVEVSQVNPKVFSLFEEIYGGSITGGYKRGNNARLVYYWSCPREQQQRMLLDIAPYLRLKQRQAQIVLTYFDYVPKRNRWSAPLTDEQLKTRDTLHTEMRELNKRGLSLRLVS